MVEPPTWPIRAWSTARLLPHGGHEQFGVVLFPLLKIWVAAQPLQPNNRPKIWSAAQISVPQKDATFNMAWSSLGSSLKRARTPSQIPWWEMGERLLRRRKLAQSRAPGLDPADDISHNFIFVHHAAWPPPRAAHRLLQALQERIWRGPTQFGT